MSEDPTQPRAGGSPAQSALAVFAGFVAFTLLNALYGSVVYRLASSEFPDAEGEGTLSTLGMGLTLGGYLPNGMLAGVVTGRFAGFAAIAHAAVLAGVIGFYAMMSSHVARGLPGWFALGRIVVPSLAIVVGGAIARASQARRAKRSA